MKCDRCGYSDNGSGDWAHACGPVAVQRAPVMNSRIQELAEQATVWKDANHGYTFDKEKFAELIIRECATLVDAAFDIDEHSGEVVSYADGGQLKEHFGVEE